MRRTETQGRYDSLMEQLERWGTFVLSNLAWVLFAIPIITIPLGTVGIFQVMSMWVRGKQPEFFKDFFLAIRHLWLRAMIVGFLDAITGGLILANIQILSMMEFTSLLAIASRTVTLFGVLLLLMVNLYVWSLLVVAELSLRRILEMSFKLVFTHPFETILILIGGLLPVLLNIFLMLPVLITMFVTISLSVLIINKGTWRVIRRYIPEGELQEYEAASTIK